MNGGRVRTLCFALAIGVLVASCHGRRAAAPPSPVPARAVTASATAPVAGRRIVQVFPTSVVAGRGFQVQPSGASAVAVKGEAFARGDVVFWNGTRLATTFGGATLLTALVPSQLYAAPGKVVISVRDPADAASAELKAGITVLPRR
jgi:hypothetical protein